MARKKKTAEISKDYQEFNLLTGEFQAPDTSDEVNMDDYKIHRNGPFDILDMIFKRPAEFDALPDSELESFAFLLNRRFAIKYPMQAAAFSKMSANQAWVLRAWAVYIRRVEGTNNVPRFLYTSTKAPAKQKVGIDQFDEEVLTSYMKRYDLSRKDFADMLQFFNEETVAHVEHFWKMNDKNEQKKMFRGK